MSNILNLEYNETSTEYKVTFLSREPFWKKDGYKYGYKINHDGEEKVIFVTDRLNKEIQGIFKMFPQNDYLITTGKYKGYSVSKINLITK